MEENIYSGSTPNSGLFRTEYGPIGIVLSFLRINEIATLRIVNKVFKKAFKLSVKRDLTLDELYTVNSMYLRRDYRHSIEKIISFRPEYFVRIYFHDENVTNEQENYLLVSNAFSIYELKILYIFVYQKKEIPSFYLTNSIVREELDNNFEIEDFQTTEIHLISKKSNLSRITRGPIKRDENSTLKDEFERRLEIGIIYPPKFAVKFLVRNSDIFKYVISHQGIINFHYGARKFLFHLLENISKKEDESNFYTVKKILVFMIRNNYNIDYIGGNSPLLFYLMNKYIKSDKKIFWRILKFLLKNHSEDLNVFVKDRKGNNLLHFSALITEKKKFFNYFKRNYPTFLSLKNFKGRVVLYTIIKTGNLKLLKYFLKKKLDFSVCVKDNSGLGLLPYSIKRCEFEIIKYFLENGKEEILQIDKAKNNVLHLLFSWWGDDMENVESRKSKILHYLWEKYSDNSSFMDLFLKKNVDDKTPFHYIFYNYFFETLKFLLPKFSHVDVSEFVNLAVVNEIMKKDQFTILERLPLNIFNEKFSQNWFLENFDVKDYYGKYKLPIHTCCIFNKVEMVKILIEKFKVEINSFYFDKNGCKVYGIQVLCKNGFFSILELFLKAGADIFVWNSKKQSIFHVLSIRVGGIKNEESRKLMIVKKLFEEKDEEKLNKMVVANDEFGLNCLLYCIDSKFCDIFFYFLGKIRVDNLDIQRMIVKSVKRDLPRVIKHFLDSEYFDIDCNLLIDENEMTMLNYASRVGAYETVKYLMKNNANYNIVDKKFKHNPIQKAALYKNGEIVEYFLKKKVQVSKNFRKKYSKYFLE